MKKISFLLLTLFLFSCSGKDDQEVQALGTDTKSNAISMTVYKDPNCGCCSKWIEHIEKSGISVTKKDLNGEGLANFKFHHGIEPQYQSCHTGQTAGGYLFEGHIPAKTILRFLEEKPEGALGLTVPAMPVGTPGMEVGDKFLPYKVFMLMESGEPQVYAEFNGYEEQF